MCNRTYQIGLSRKAEQEERLVLDDEVRQRIRDSYNIAPTQELFTVHRAGEHWGATYRRWGIKQTARPQPLLNSRDDTMQSKPGYFASFQRILVPVSGFFEWPVLNGRKRAYTIRPVDHEALWWFAGLMKAQDGDERVSIMTVAPTAAMSEIHRRWPLILHPDDRDAWLDPATPRTDLFALMKAPPDEWADAYEIGAAVGYSENNCPELLKPIA